MIALLLSLSAACAAFAGLVWLAVAGLRDGDRPSDVLIVPEIAGGDPAAAGAVRLRLANPGPTTALVSLRAEPRRTRACLRGSRARGGNPARLARELARGDLRDGELLAVPAGGTVLADLALPARSRRVTVVAIVGTRARLRRHRLVVEVEPALEAAALSPLSATPTPLAESRRTSESARAAQACREY